MHFCISELWNLPGTIWAILGWGRRGVASEKCHSCRWKGNVERTLGAGVSSPLLTASRGEIYSQGLAKVTHTSLDIRLHLIAYWGKQGANKERLSLPCSPFITLMPCLDGLAWCKLKDRQAAVKNLKYLKSTFFCLLFSSPLALVPVCVFFSGSFNPLITSLSFTPPPFPSQYSWMLFKAWNQPKPQFFRFCPSSLLAGSGG